MLWRPRSIRQLVLVGFGTVIAPLCLAIFYTLQTFDQQALKNSQITQQLVSLTRGSQVLQSDLLDLERQAGQYAALGDERLLEPFRQGHGRIIDRLMQLDPLVDSERGFWLLSLNEAMERLRVSMQAPRSSFDAERALVLFDEINQLSLKFRQASLHYVDQQLQGQVEEASQIKASLLWMVLLLALMTLLLAWCFIYWINRPVRELEREISQLGSGDLSREIRIHGPQEMQQLGERLDWLRGQLHELDAQKQQFLRHMSHELKTPLASLREGADLMAEGVVGELEPRQLEIVGIIQQNSRELQRLIENLLDYNQVLYQQQLSMGCVDISALWQELLAGYRMTIERKQLQVQCQGPKLHCTADPAKLRTVLDNLLSNAVSYCPPGEHVLIEWWQDGRGFCCQVANSGQDIPEGERQKIFEPFFQGSNSRSGAIKGSGIGLSVARECTHAHQGTLELVAGGPLAVCFSLTLPHCETNA